MRFDSLKDKCEYYRSLTDYKLLPNSNILVMLDGNNFSTLVKNNFNLPFDDDFINMMNHTALSLCNQVAGVKFAYTQSDEISLLITDYDTPVTETLYNGRLCKIQSILAGIATAEFNRLYIPYILKKKSDADMLRQNTIAELINTMKLAKFDCKAWVVPTINDVYAWFLYRQHDCIRNSKQQAAQTYLSHNTLMGLDTDLQIQRLFDTKGIDWNEFEDGKKFGRFIYKENQVFSRVINDKIINFDRAKFDIHPAYILDDNKDKFLNLINETIYKEK
jgi:tRNA(His) 5'-end guanylyltransferase